jgi:hypothetical protein
MLSRHDREEDYPSLEEMWHKAEEHALAISAPV